MAWDRTVLELGAARTDYETKRDQLAELREARDLLNAQRETCVK